MTRRLESAKSAPESTSSQYQGERRIEESDVPVRILLQKPVGPPAPVVRSAEVVGVLMRAASSDCSAGGVPGSSGARWAEATTVCSRLHAVAAHDLVGDHDGEAR